MSNVEVITDGGRRRYWSYDEKLRIVETSLAPGESVSRVARLNGVNPDMLYRWRRLLSASNYWVEQEKRTRFMKLNKEQLAICLEYVLKRYLKTWQGTSEEAYERLKVYFRGGREGIELLDARVEQTALGVSPRSCYVAFRAYDLAQEILGTFDDTVRLVENVGNQHR